MATASTGRPFSNHRDGSGSEAAAPRCRAAPEGRRPAPRFTRTDAQAVYCKVRPPVDVHSTLDSLGSRAPPVPAQLDQLRYQASNPSWERWRPRPSGAWTPRRWSPLAGRAPGGHPKGDELPRRPSLTARPSSASRWSVKYWNGTLPPSSPWNSIGVTPGQQQAAAIRQAPRVIGVLLRRPVATLWFCEQTTVCPQPPVAAPGCGDGTFAVRRVDPLADAWQHSSEPKSSKPEGRR